jgi:growth arrest-specific protein 8
MPPAKKVPPKKAKTKVSKAKATGTSDKSIDETDVSHQETRADLLAKIQAVEREAVKASEHQNYMQLERDKIDAFWEITKRELQSTKIDLRDVRRELEVMEENHAMELRVQQHKIRQIEHERLEAEEAIRAEYSEMEIAIRQACRRENISVENEKLNIESEMRELSRENEAQCRKLKLEYAANLGDARKAFEENASSKVKEAEERMFAAMNSFQSRINEQLRDAEIRKSEHIEALVAIHNSAYTEMKDYFNALTGKHLEYSDRMLKDARAQVKALKWENEILIQKLERVEGELDVARISANGNLEHIRRVFAGAAR